MVFIPSIVPMYVSIKHRSLNKMFRCQKTKMQTVVSDMFKMFRICIQECFIIRSPYEKKKKTERM